MQRNIFIYLILFCLCISNIKSQQVYFNKRYAFNENSWDGANNVLTVSGGYLIAGWAPDTLTGNYYRTAFVFIDSSGNVIWKKSHGETGYYYYSGYGSSLIKTTDGGYALGNSLIDSAGEYYSFLMKFDANGDTVWTKKYGAGGVFYNGAQCKQTSDKGYVIIGATDIMGSTDILLIKTDSAGNLEWQKTYGGGNTEYGYTIDVCDDGGYILGGNVIYGASSTDVYIIKTDSIGNQEWSRTFGGSYTDGVGHVINTLDGGYIVGAILTDSQPNTSIFYSQLYLIKLDGSGNTIWENTYGSITYATNLWSIYESEDSSFIISGQTSNTAKHRVGLLAKISSVGDSVWYRTYDLLKGQNSQNYLRDVKPANQGGYIAVGFVNPSVSSGDTGTQDMWFLKVDSSGCVDLNCTVGIEENLPDDATIKVFPNPSSDYTTFLMKEFNTNERYYFVLYDVLGREIKSIKNILINPFHVSNNNLSEGIYMYKIFSGNNIIHSGKIVHQ